MHACIGLSTCQQSDYTKRRLAPHTHTHTYTPDKHAIQSIQVWQTHQQQFGCNNWRDGKAPSPRCKYNKLLRDSASCMSLGPCTGDEYWYGMDGIYSRYSRMPGKKCYQKEWMYWMIKKVKVKFSPYTFPSVGLGADPGVQAVSPQVTKPSTRLYVVIIFRQACGYLPNRRASPTIGWYQIILLVLGDRGTCGWAACQRLLHGSGPAEIRERDILGPERTLYRSRGSSQGCHEDATREWVP